MNPNKSECVRPFLRQSKFVAGNVEGRALGTTRGLDLEQALAASCIERQNIVAGTIAIFMGDPTDPFGQLFMSGVRLPSPLDLQDKFLTCLAQPAIAFITRSRIEATNKSNERFVARLSGGMRRRRDKNRVGI